MRNYILLYINGERVTVSGDRAFLPFSSFLRYELQKTGTKVVCAEGDCGACSIIVAFPERPKVEGLPRFRVLNSCIAPTFLMDGASVVTVEGLCQNGKMNEVQDKMVKCFGSQCGFCTPGFVMAMTSMFEQHTKVDSQTIKNHTTGNLCRCTGYETIIQAGLQVDPSKLPKLEKDFLSTKISGDLKRESRKPFLIETKTKKVFAPTKTKDVSKYLLKNPGTRIVSAATDLGVQYNKEKIELESSITLHHVPELFEVNLSKKALEVGTKVDLSTLQKVAKQSHSELARFLNIFASPQIRNVATLGGNLANASPIGDTIPFLMACDANVEIQGLAKSRFVPVREFIKGYRKIDLKRGEWIKSITIPAIQSDEHFYLYKVSQRRDLDISTVVAGFWVKKDQNKFKDIRIVYGGVAPVTLRLFKTEKYLKNKAINTEVISGAKKLLSEEIGPISDLRASAEYRSRVSLNLFQKFFIESNVL